MASKGSVHSSGWDRNHRHCAISRSTRHYVNQLVASHVDDRSAAPLLGSPPAFPPQQRLVNAHSLGPRLSGRCRPQEGFAPSDHLVAHRMPPTTQFCGDLFDRTTPPTHLDGHPPGGSRCQQRPHRPNRGVLFDERSPEPGRPGAAQLYPAPTRIRIRPARALLQRAAMGRRTRPEAGTTRLHHHRPDLAPRTTQQLRTRLTSQTPAT